MSWLRVRGLPLAFTVAVSFGINQFVLLMPLATSGLFMVLGLLLLFATQGALTFVLLRAGWQTEYALAWSVEGSTASIDHELRCIDCRMAPGKRKDWDRRLVRLPFPRSR